MFVCYVKRCEVLRSWLSKPCLHQQAAQGEKVPTQKKEKEDRQNKDWKSKWINLGEKKKKDSRTTQRDDSNRKVLEHTRQGFTYRAIRGANDIFTVISIWESAVRTHRMGLGYVPLIRWVSQIKVFIILVSATVMQSCHVKSQGALVSFYLFVRYYQSWKGIFFQEAWMCANA